MLQTMRAFLLERRSSCRAATIAQVSHYATTIACDCNINVTHLQSHTRTFVAVPLNALARRSAFPIHPDISTRCLFQPKLPFQRSFLFTGGKGNC